MNEIEQYLETKQDITEGTKTTYRNVYKKLKQIFEINDKRKKIYTKPIVRIIFASKMQPHPVAVMFLLGCVIGKQS